MKNIKDRVHHYYNIHSLSPDCYISPVPECTNQSDKTLLIVLRSRSLLKMQNNCGTSHRSTITTFNKRVSKSESVGVCPKSILHSQLLLFVINLYF